MALKNGRVTIYYSLSVSSPVYIYSLAGWFVCTLCTRLFKESLGAREGPSSSLRPDKNPGEKERREELFSKFKESTLKSFCSCWPRRVCACKGRGGERGGFEKWIRI